MGRRSVGSGRRRAARPLTGARRVALLWLLFLPALGYQLFSLFACVRQFLRPHKRSDFLPPVSILKPLRGADPGMYAAFVSQVQQDYPTFEILFGVAEREDAAVPIIERLQREFFQLPIYLYVGSGPGANGKVGVLSNLALYARHPVWVVSDGDIQVNPDYLQSIVAPLADLKTGVVTCLYRPQAYSAAAAWEGFGVAIDFMPSTLVAQLIGVREFGLGSTLCFRAEDLHEVGGFGEIADYIADDYQLASRLVRSGKRARLSRYVVDTSLGDTNWSGIWQHQLRWARTIKATKGKGFAGLPITHAGVWALLATFLGLWPMAVVLLGMRIAAAIASGWLVLRLETSLFWALLAPFWDFYAFAVWAFSYASDEVLWRDRRLRIKPNGRVEPIT
jgi:ceramide glucosyltransferase